MTREILTNAQMTEADRRTIAGGVEGYELMQNAGRAAAEFILERYDARNIMVLCGPGNNGGDGFVIAQLLQKAKRKVTCASVSEPHLLEGDAAQACKDWKGETISFGEVRPERYDLIIDAVFGTGFRGPLEGAVALCFQAIKHAVVAIDIPSGVNGDTGEADPLALKADYTITFHRKKLGHILYPGREYCGEVIRRDIGIAADFDYEARENHPDIWEHKLPKRKGNAHKYEYGLAAVYGAPELTGATRLAASACARIGTGLTTVLSTPETTSVYRTSLPAHIMVRDDLKWNDERVSACLYGPGGMPKGVKISFNHPAVFDADALFCMPETLNDQTILTPHDGEFAKAFPEIDGTRLEKASQAAKQTGAVVVLKGAETLIAHPDGRLVISVHASPYLATAGSGDVLAGMITGLLAQGMPPFEAACAAVWMHGECALQFGPGLVASDLVDIIPKVLKETLGI